MFWCNVKEKGVFFLGGILLVGSNPRHIYFFTQFLPKKIQETIRFGWSPCCNVLPLMVQRSGVKSSFSHDMIDITRSLHCRGRVTSLFDSTLLCSWYVYKNSLLWYWYNLSLFDTIIFTLFIYIYTYYLWAYIFISIYVCFFEARDLLPKCVVTSTSGD